MDKEIINNFLREIARKGGKKTAKRGKKYYSMIGKLGVKAKLKKQNESKI
jgi:hypothetical protein